MRSVRLSESRINILTNFSKQRLYRMFGLVAVAAAKKIQVVQNMIEVINMFTDIITGIQRIIIAVSGIKIGWKAAEKFGHGDIRFAIAVIDCGIE